MRRASTPYHLRATALFQLRQNRQAIRDFNKVLELNPNANIYNDRALAKMDLLDYRGAVLDYTKAIANGCHSSFCYS
jgi:tetratricopeptide (TPR) repeat protein